MNCEYCGKSHDGSYGSGRFCCKSCACGFVTKEKRQEINQKVKSTFDNKFANIRYLNTEKRKQTLLAKYGQIGTINIHTDTIEKIKDAIKEYHKNRALTLPFDKLGKAEKRKRIFHEQNGCCLNCNLSTWLDKPIKLELDHVDGDRENNTRENLRLICPNCHSYTDTFRGKNIKGIHVVSKVADDQFVDALKTHKNIRSALLSLNIAPYGGNYERAKKLITQYQLDINPTMPTK